MNPLRALEEQGQSIWLDNMRRGLVTSGALKKLIDEDGVKGLTSNPTIFQKAVEGSQDYDELFETWAPKRAKPGDVFEALAVRDIQDAAKLFRGVYDRTKGGDGFCSLEVSPTLAHDTEGSVEEARRLWKALGQPNVMIKIPGTREGVPAIEKCISEGININITLLFSQDAHAAVAEAYLRGLETLAKRGGDISRVASVASFFVSRIDSLVEKRIAERTQEGATDAQKKLFAEVTGKVAIANAKLAYRRYGQIFSGARWKALADKGARPQRVLWASTGTKNPKYSDVLYVEELIGPETVNTIPPATLDAFRDHGKVRRTLTEGLPEAEATMAALEKSGLSMKEITAALVEDGVNLFDDSFRQLLAAVGSRIGAGGAAP